MDMGPKIGNFQEIVPSLFWGKKQEIFLDHELAQKIGNKYPILEYDMNIMFSKINQEPSFDRNKKVYT